ncbi:MAG: histidine--tRNA ligase [Chloroflexi bacterium]|nr:histidine--tRNA ligase [Chloroflexota bacterium]
MPERITPRLPRGMRDILPEKMILRDYVMNTIRTVFEQFGFEPLHTPAVELAETLMGKYGPDAERLIYDVRQRQGQEALALRYDLSVPLSRVVAMNPDLLLPFKRYQIAPVWRAERPQKGRYREFYQCDADIVGSASMLADAEIIAVIYTVLERLGFQRYTTRINNRKVLTGIGIYSGVAGEALGQLYRSIDKLDRIGMDGVRKELRDAGIAEDVIARMVDLLEIRGDSMAIIPEMMQRLEGIDIAAEGLAELKGLVSYLDAMGVPEGAYQIDFAMVRGLDYYTGPIYETVVEEPKIGSITGGGRYDRLIEMFSSRGYPATGTTIGIERIIDVMDELHMFPASLRRTLVEVLVLQFDPGLLAETLRFTRALREQGLRVELYFEADSVKKQFRYASRKGIPFAAILGPDEAAQGQVTIKNLDLGKQRTVPQAQAADIIRNWGREA